jgi:ATP-dependent 26S proteasome regulatory subunit
MPADKKLAGSPESLADSAAELPTWYPAWARELGELYFSGTTSTFVLHGNTTDAVPLNREGDEFGPVWQFLVEQLFGRWDLVLHFDLAKGLRPLAGRDNKRLRSMVELFNKKFGDLSAVPKDPTQVLAVLDRFVDRNLMAKPAERVRCALLFDHASYLVPDGEPARMGLKNATHLVTFLNWAANPYIKRQNMAFVLLDKHVAAVHDRLIANPNVASIEIELPDRRARQGYIEFVTRDRELSEVSDYGASELAELTAGITLGDVRTLVGSATQGGRRLDTERFREIKKRLIERSCNGLLEFIEPRWDLGMVVGHEAAKKRLIEDAELLKRGALDTLPMGYLICGPVGTGKSFLAQCVSGSMGVPCVMLKNFRSKYVGETEANLQMVLQVLRAMGPVVVVIDEADAAVGDRDQGGDSGTSQRVFAMLASQMGDTRYRGRILWMLLTSRPDLLPIDIKRQGRAEVHIPLFYPQLEEEIRGLFVALGKKLDAPVQADDVPEVPYLGWLSGADIEGLVGRAWRRSLLSGSDHVTPEALKEAVDQFMPSTQSLEKELQEVAAIIECTDRDFLPPRIAEEVEQAGGRQAMQSRLTRIKQMVERL